MAFTVTPVDQTKYVRVVDSATVRVYFVLKTTYDALDITSYGAQARLAAAAEFSLDGQKRVMKSSINDEGLVISHILQLSDKEHSKPMHTEADVQAIMSVVRGVLNVPAK